MGMKTASTVTLAGHVIVGYACSWVSRLVCQGSDTRRLTVVVG